MLKKTIILLATCFTLAACAEETPHIVQASTSMPEVRLTAGMASQIEMPSSGHVQSVVVGNPSLLTAERSYNVVNLIPKEGSGETNLIVRFINDDGDMKVYQYRVIVQER